MQCNTMVASLYIPIIKPDITDEFIQKCFHEHNIGKVSHVDFVFNKQKSRREAFVHFSEWYDTEIANKLKHKLENRYRIYMSIVKDSFNQELPDGGSEAQQPIGGIL